MRPILLVVIFLSMNVVYAETSDNWIEKGVAAKTYREKLECFKKALETDPANGKAYHFLGETESNEGNFFNAIKYFDTAVQINPGNPETYVERGYAKYLLGDIQGHEQDCMKAIEVDPKYDWAYYRLGVAYETQGKWDKAIEYYSKGIKVDPTYKACIDGRRRAQKEKYYDEWYKKSLIAFENAEANTKRQAKILERAIEIQNNQQEAITGALAIQKKQNEEAKRYEKILDFWEQQMNDYLEAKEKKNNENS